MTDRQHSFEEQGRHRKRAGRQPEGIAELGNKSRAHNGFQVFRELTEHMPAPKNVSAESTLFHLSKRYQRFVVPEDYEPKGD